MKDPNLRTTVIGSYPLPGWYEYAFSNISSFGEYDRNELINDAVSTVIRDQIIKRSTIGSLERVNTIRTTSIQKPALLASAN